MIIKIRTSLLSLISIGFVITLSTHFLFAQSTELFFTKKKTYKFSDLKTQAVFYPGDTIYGVIYVNLDEHQLIDYTYVQDEKQFVPFTVETTSAGAIQQSADFSSGLGPKKKSGFKKFLKEVNSYDPIDPSNGQQFFCFLVLPVNSSGLDTEWQSWLKRIVLDSEPKKELQVTAGRSNGSVLKKSVYLDMSTQTEPYSTWIKPMLDQEKSKRKQKEIDKQNALAELRKKEIADSIAKWSPYEKSLIASDKIPLPTPKIKKPKAEKAILNYLRNKYYSETFYEVYIMEEGGYGKSLEYTVKVTTRNSEGFCYLSTATVRVDNPLPDEYYPNEDKFFGSTTMKCERFLKTNK